MEPGLDGVSLAFGQAAKAERAGKSREDAVDAAVQLRRAVQLLNQFVWVELIWVFKGISAHIGVPTSPVQGPYCGYITGQTISVNGGWYMT